MIGTCCVARPVLLALLLLPFGFFRADLVAASPAGVRVAYVIDYSSQTLDRVDLDLGTVDLGLVPVGIVPNQLRVAGATAYVVNSVPENLQIIDLSTLTSQEVPLPPGSNPWAVEVAGDVAYVTLFGSDQLAVIDLTTVALLEFIPVGRAPEGLCLVGSELYVANSGFVAPGAHEAGSVMVVDLATRSVTATIPVGINPQWCALDAGGEVNVVCSGLFGVDGGQVTFIDSATRAVVDSAHVGGFPGPIAIDSRGIAYMVEFGAGLLTVDTVTNTAVRDVGNPIPVGGLGAFGLAIDQNDRVAVAVSADGLLTVVSPDGAIDAAFAVGGGPQDTDLFEPVATAVTLTHFSAARSGADVSLDWQVGADASIGGFHVERRTSPRAAFQRLTAGLVTGMEEAPGTRFRYVDRAAGPGTLEYRLLALYRDGTEEVLGPFRVVSATPPARFSAVRPNPVRPGPGAAAIELRLDATGETSVRLLDVTGRPVRVLHRGVLAAGTHVLSWDGRGAEGRRLPAGVYFVHVAAPGAAATHKVTVVD